MDTILSSPRRLRNAPVSQGLPNQGILAPALFLMPLAPEMGEQIGKSNEKHGKSSHRQHAAARIKDLYHEIGKENAQSHPHQEYRTCTHGKAALPYSRSVPAIAGERRRDQRRRRCQPYHFSRGRATLPSPLLYPKNPCTRSPTNHGRIIENPVN
jgi:hypothetical protein